MIDNYNPNNNGYLNSNPQFTINFYGTTAISQTPDANPGVDTSAELCQDSSNVDLFGLIQGSPDSGGSFTDPLGNPHSGIFTAGSDPFGTYVYSIIGISCQNTVSSNLTIIDGTPFAGTDNTIDVCSNSPSVNLIFSLGGAETGGTWADPLNNTHSGMFDPSSDPVGAYTYTVTDIANGCKESAVVTVSVNNNDLPPTALCKDITRSIPSAGTLTISPNEIDNGSYDDCGISFKSLNPNTFNCNDVGNQIVTLTVFDLGGQSSSCTAMVTITDSNAPTPDLTNLPDITETCSASITNTPTATDNCTGSVTATTTDPLVYNSQGTFDITWTYDDGNGNSSTQTQNVIVSDTIAPIVNSSPSDIIQANDAGICGAFISWSAPVASDNCSSTTLSRTDGAGLNSGDAFPIGTTTISYKIEDAVGNFITTSFNVTVTDTAAPIVNTPPRACK